MKQGEDSVSQHPRRSFVAAALAAALAAVNLAACAPEIKRTPVELTPLPPGDSTGVFTFKNEVTFSPAMGYSRTIAAGSQWRLIGRISSGEVYRPMSGVFTVESAQVHEAGIVIWQGKLTGFYMLVERAFVPLDPPVAVQLVQGVK
jgi:hypothetical protein